MDSLEEREFRNTDQGTGDAGMERRIHEVTEAITGKPNVRSRRKRVLPATRRAGVGPEGGLTLVRLRGQEYEAIYEDGQYALTGLVNSRRKGRGSRKS